MADWLVIPTLALHLLCVNVASAGPIVCMWLEWRDGRGDKLGRDAGIYLSTASLVTLVLGVALGLGVGVFLWDDSYSAVLQRFPRRIWYGLIELAFTAVLVALHALWWKYTRNTGVVLRTLRCLLLLAAGSNLLYHFPFLFVLISNVAASGDTSTEVLDGKFTTMIADSAVLAKVTHFILAAFAVSGVMLIGFGLKLRRTGNEADAARVAVWGGRIALVPTVLQLIVGLWVTLTLPAAGIHRVMGGDLIATSLLVVSILAALYMMHMLAAISFGDTSKGKLIGAMSLMVVVVVLMTAVLRMTKAVPAPSNNTNVPAVTSNR